MDPQKSSVPGQARPRSLSGENDCTIDITLERLRCCCRTAFWNSSHTPIHIYILYIYVCYVQAQDGAA